MLPRSASLFSKMKQMYHDRHVTPSCAAENAQLWKDRDQYLSPIRHISLCSHHEKRDELAFPPEQRFILFRRFAAHLFSNSSQGADFSMTLANGHIISRSAFFHPRSRTHTFDRAPSCPRRAAVLVCPREGRASFPVRPGAGVKLSALVRPLYANRKRQGTQRFPRVR